MHDGKSTRTGSLVFLGPAVVLLLSYLLLSSPGQLVTTSTGEVRGMANRVRVVIQGQKFWREQLVSAQEELKRLRAEARMLSELQQSADQAIRDAETTIDDVMNHPSLRKEREKMLSEREARKRQSAVEQHDINEAVERAGTYRAVELEATIALIQRKLTSP